MAALQKVMAGAKKKITDGFRFLDNVSEWNLVDPKHVADTEKTPLEELATQRPVMNNAIYLTASKTFPAYVAPSDILDSEGKKTGETKLVGYIYIDSFDPSDSSEDDVLKEFKSTLLAMQTLRVKDLIIDTLNNGGGSLSLGMKMAQLLSNHKIEMPKIQFRLSDTWLDEFQSSSLEGNSDAEKEYSLRLLNDLKSQQTAGQRMSNEYSAEVLSPFSIVPNSELDAPFKTVLLVNEMCASMCDIFAGILQDNKLATVMGTRSMGAGGNVVDLSPQEAPASHFDLRQTESLMIRKDGTKIENNGVTPDVELAVNQSAKTKYDDVLGKAVEYLTKAPAPITPKP